MNGFLIFLASSNRYKKVSIISMIVWFVFMSSRADFSLGYVFPLVNLFIFILISNISKIYNNRTFNKIYSIFSILLWGACIDLVCYFIFPNMVFGQSIFQYIANGIIFNSKFVIYNILYIFVLEVIMTTLKEINIRKYVFFNKKVLYE